MNIRKDRNGVGWALSPSHEQPSAGLGAHPSAPTRGAARQIGDVRALVAFALLAFCAASMAARPNIVLVMADDQGWGDDWPQPERVAAMRVELET